MNHSGDWPKQKTEHRPLTANKQIINNSHHNNNKQFLFHMPAIITPVAMTDLKWSDIDTDSVQSIQSTQIHHHHEQQQQQEQEEKHETMDDKLLISSITHSSIDDNQYNHSNNNAIDIINEKMINTNNNIIDINIIDGNNTATLINTMNEIPLIPPSHQRVSSVVSDNNCSSNLFPDGDNESQSSTNSIDYTMALSPSWSEHCNPLIVNNRNNHHNNNNHVNNPITNSNNNSNTSSLQLDEILIIESSEIKQSNIHSNPTPGPTLSIPPLLSSSTLIPSTIIISDTNNNNNPQKSPSHARRHQSLSLTPQITKSIINTSTATTSKTINISQASNINNNKLFTSNNNNTTNTIKNSLADTSIIANTNITKNIINNNNNLYFPYINYSFSRCPVIRSGYLFRRIQNSSWTKFLFVLVNFTTIIYFDNEHEAKATGAININHKSIIKEITDLHNNPNTPNNNTNNNDHRHILLLDQINSIHYKKKKLFTSSTRIELSCEQFDEFNDWIFLLKRIQLWNEEDFLIN